MGSAKNYISGSAIMVSHVQVLASQGENSFHREKKEVGRAVVNEESMVLHSMSPYQEKKVYLLSVGLCYIRA